MAVRCDCTGKFVGLETGEPEENSIEFSGGTITLDVRLTRNCVECGEEKKETTFELVAELDSDAIAGHEKEHHNGAEMGDDNYEVSAEYEASEGGGGRYAKNMIGITAHWTLVCGDCQGTDKSDNATVAEGDVSDEIAASGFDEL